MASIFGTKDKKVGAGLALPKKGAASSAPTKPQSVFSEIATLPLVACNDGVEASK
jgi:hypothetical protein